MHTSMGLNDDYVYIEFYCLIWKQIISVIIMHIPIDSDNVSPYIDDYVCIKCLHRWIFTNLGAHTTNGYLKYDSWFGKVIGVLAWLIQNWLRSHFYLLISSMSTLLWQCTHKLLLILSYLCITRFVQIKINLYNPFIVICI